MERKSENKSPNLIQNEKSCDTNKENSLDNHLNDSIFKKTKNFLYSFLFDLPFDNYHKYYKTGKIHTMTEDEKRTLLDNKKSDSQYKKLLFLLISLRPNVLDDQDMMDMKEFNNKMKKYYAIVIGGLVLNWAYFSYNFIIKKKALYKNLMILNFLCFLAYIKVDSYKQHFYDGLVQKYKHIIKKQDLQNIIKKTYNID